MMPLRSLRERLLSWALRGLVVEIDPSRLVQVETQVDRLRDNAQGDYRYFVDRLDRLTDRLDRGLSELTGRLDTQGGTLGEFRRQLAAVESRADADRAKLDALDEYARSLPTEDDVIRHIESSEYCAASNLAARFRALAREVEAVRDTKVTEDDLRSGKVKLGEGITLADLGFDLAQAPDTDTDAEGETGEFPAACPAAGPRCDDCDCGLAD